MGSPYHGKNGLIYVSGVELTGANAWTINITTDSVETPQFGDSWKKRVIGMNDWSGSLTAWGHSDSKLLLSAATAGSAQPLLIYPTRASLANYFSGNAIFGANEGGGVSSAVDRSGDFVGNDTLTITGTP
jgi:hypothetical protein